MASIGIDATAAQKGGKGVFRYQKNIVRSLFWLESKHEYFVFHTSFNSNGFGVSRSNWHFCEVSISKGIVWEQVQLPRLAKKHRLDLVYVVGECLPLWSSVPLVMHVFEIPNYRVACAKTKKFFPRWHHGLSEQYRVSTFPHSLRKASLIVTSSQFTKQDLIKRFHTPQQKIRVVYAAQDNHFQPAGDSQTRCAIRSRLTEGEEYLLHFSTGDPRDNTGVVLEAFKKAKSRIPFGVKLVIVGGFPANGNHFSSNLAQDRSIVWQPFLAEEELIEYYQGASLYVDSSLYEGFGFQPLEAMACGVPVIASNATATPEIVGEAAFLVNPNDSDDVANAIVTVLTDCRWRSELRERGFKRILAFNWDQTAERIHRIFEEVLQRGLSG